MQTSRLVVFLHEVYRELQMVGWPSRQQVARLTMIVIVVSVVVGTFIGLLDFSLTSTLDVLVTR